LGLVDTLVTHANTKGFGLTSMSGVRRDFMLPQLKTKNELKNLEEIQDQIAICAKRKIKVQKRNKSPNRKGKQKSK